MSRWTPAKLEWYRPHGGSDGCGCVDGSDGVDGGFDGFDGFDGLDGFDGT